MDRPGPRVARSRRPAILDVRVEVPVTDLVRVDPISIFARRAGRIAASLVLLVGVGMLVVAAWQGHGDRYGYREASRLHALPILGVTWATALIVAAVAHGTVLLLRPSWRPDQLFVSSLMLPTVALALVLPITLHALVAIAYGGRAGDFDGWVWWSVIVSGLAHLVFAWLSAVRVHRLVTDRPPMTPRRIFALTVATSCVPFVLLFGIPPIIVAITGVPLLPLLHRMARWIARERAELAAMPHRLPRAALVVRRD
jgi:hypothetical protein